MVGTNEEDEGSSNSNKQLIDSFRAMMGESLADMKAEIQSINDRLRRNPQSTDVEQYYSHSSRSHQTRRRRPREDQLLRNHQTTPRDPLAGVKIEIPTFHGTTDPEEYLEWEKRVEIIFSCKEFTQENKVRVAPTAFKDYALSWWDQLVTSRNRTGDLPVETWNQMKVIMRRRFIPSHYHRELHMKLRNLSQGNRSVEEYYKELETLLFRADIQEDNEAAMARFMGGLNRDIIERLEVHHYVEMDELLHKAVMFEKQLKRKNFKPGYGSARFSQNKEEKPSKEYRPFSKPKNEELPLKGIDKGSSTKAREIQCFKCKGFGHYSNACTNKRTIVILASGEVESEDDRSEDESIEEHVAMPVVGQLLVTRRTLNLHTKSEKNEQRENLFHTRCLVNEKVCSLVIDGGSCTNVASESMVEKLGLVVIKRDKPYKLQWLNDEGELEVKSQVIVPLSIGKYEDEVLCDILPMDAGHILLGRPWQFDRRVQHEGFTNRYLFEHQGRKIVLVPMTPQEVYQDQIQLKTKSDTKANKDCEDVINTILNKEEPPGSPQEVKLQESPREATTRVLKGFTQAEAVLVYHQLPSADEIFVIKNKPPDASSPINTRGNYLNSQKRMRANLLSLGADCSSLRSKPLQEEKTTLVPLPAHEFYKIKLKGNQEQDMKVKFFPMASKVKDAEHFDPKLFIFVDKLSCVSNLAPVLPSELNKILQDISLGNNPRNLPFDNLHHYSLILLYDGIHFNIKENRGQRNNEAIEDYQANLGAKYCAYVGKKKLFTYGALPNKESKESIQVHAMSVLKNQGLHSSFKNILKLLHLKILQPGHMDDFLITNMEISFCLVRIKARDHKAYKKQMFELKNRNSTKDFAGNRENGKAFKASSKFKDEPPDVLLMIKSNYNHQIAIIIQTRDKELEISKVSIFVLNNPFIFDHTDMIRLSLSQEPKTGFRAVFKHTRRTKKRKENKRFKPPDQEKGKHQGVTFFILIEEEPPDPTPLSFTMILMNTEHNNELVQVSISFPQFVSHDSRDVLMSLLSPEIIEKKLGVLKKYLESNFCRKLQVNKKHDMDNALVQNESCLFVYCDSMTLITHLLFAKGVDYIAGTKEEPPDLEVLSSNYFVRTGIGVVLTKELNMLQISVLVEMIMKLGLLSKALKETFHDAKRIINLLLTLSFPYLIESYRPLLFDASNLALFVADRSDLRTNPFQEGEDDESMARKEDEAMQSKGDNEDQRKQLEPEQQGHEDLHISPGSITRSKQVKLQTTLQHLLNTIQGSLVCANPTTLVVIQAT